MSVWGHVFAWMYDPMMAKTEAAVLSDHRRALLPSLTGDVLEIGGGTGTNLPFYGESVTALVVTEPERPMARRLQKRIQEQRPEAKLLRAPAEDLPFNDHSFDAVVSTLVLCTVDDQPRALRELRRVLRPGGRLVFIEHVRAENPTLARLQDRMMPLHIRLAHGCHCNRSTVDGMRNAGFEIAELADDTLKHAPRWVRPLVVGVAVAPSSSHVASTFSVDDARQPATHPSIA